MRRDVNDQFNCAKDNWIKEKCDDSVKERWPLKSGYLIIELENDSGVDDHDTA